ncbi:MULTISPECIES: hypothetical protein [Calothrix]|uniref:Transposase n=2 Tax=Calothrix TaxID=1186 RepID=A0ABR8AHS9_9CYAN|nr:hypothetical protein [Calothrix parietina]MBD2199498.1 hypothetical protein [Calothrix parietina FACHB-288]MBD2228122.1 hypothetical protein [Calothrix anomala FACHB-343]
MAVQTLLFAFSLANYMILVSFMGKQAGIPKYNSNHLQLLALKAVWLNALDNTLRIILTFTPHPNSQSHILRGWGGQP